MKRFFLHFLRIVISLGLLIYLIYIADLQKVYQTIRKIDPGYFGLAMGIFIVAVFVLTLRWLILLSPYQMNPGYSKLFIFYAIGFFFNNFLPTTIGGDISRAYNLAKTSGKKAESLGIILLERLMGILATLTYASLSLIWVAKYFHTPRIIFLTLAMLAAVGYVMLNLLNPRLFGFTTRILEKITYLRLGNRINHVLESIHFYRHHTRHILTAYGLSLVSQFLLILMNYSLARGLHLHQITLGYLFLVIPITFLIGLLPSINGLGVRDSGYVFLLTRMDVSIAGALSLSFLNTLLPMLFSILGGILLIFYRVPSPAKLEEITLPSTPVEE